VGPAMNLAARLMEASPTGLLAALPLASHYRRRFRLTSAGTFALKGACTPAVPRRGEGRRSEAGTARAELFGRQCHRTAGRGIRRVRRRNWRNSSLSATRGPEVRARHLMVSHATAMGVRCVVGDCDLTEAASPYFAFVPFSACWSGDVHATASIRCARGSPRGWRPSIDQRSRRFQ
jgi:hypothetical protein